MAEKPNKEGLMIALGIGGKPKSKAGDSSEKADLMRELKDALDEDDMEGAAAAFEALYQACKEKDSEDSESEEY